MVKRPLTRAAYSTELRTGSIPPAGRFRHIAAKSRRHLLFVQEAKDRLREIVEGFFYRRLRAEDGKRVGD
jgi:hypothetical protein